MIRPKVIVVVLLAGMMLVGVASYLSRQFDRTRLSPPEESIGQAPRGTNGAQEADPARSRLRNQPSAGRQHLDTLNRERDSTPGSVTSNALEMRQTHAILESSDDGKLTEEQVNSIVETKAEQLEDLSRKSDRASMEAILAEIKSPYPEVRADAIEAIIQFRSRDAIPALKELAAQSQDPNEKVAISNAVDFLELPTLQEFRARLEQAQQQNAEETASPP
jgi:HEAT repeats